MMSYGGLVRFIKASGKSPVERDSLYETVRTFASDDPIFSEVDPPPAASPELVQLVGAGRN